jgi:hypothetical protein
MGLDTSHDCWHGAYSSFNRWRDKLAEVAGYGDLNGYVGHGGTKQFPGKSALETLLDHSDCDGEIAASDCAPLADAMELLLPALEIAGEGGGHIGNYVDKTKQFIAGLRDAAENHESVDFH